MTTDKLDEMRERAIMAVWKSHWRPTFADYAAAIRLADEAAGIPTEGLLALMRGRGRDCAGGTNAGDVGSG